MYGTLEDVVIALRNAKRQDPSGRKTLAVVEEILKSHPSPEALRKFANDITNAMSSKNLSMSGVADSIGISNIRLWQIRNGLSVSPEMAVKISGLLSINNPYT
ncbi:hypothetical protein KKC62_03445 [Patescibacteria group bacterium]|nr:hypothetical protein [Patescibacteria group bacterium]MBU1953231.1 hypothetical protein [Patescibacteria group bacterium]